jgi:hypothetical protein
MVPIVVISVAALAIAGILGTALFLRRRRSFM